MTIPPFSTLADATSPQQYSEAMADVCQCAGLQHYLVIRLCGQMLDDVMQVYENAPEYAVEVKALRHWSIARLLERMRKGGPPVVFGEGAEPGLELPGYTSGIGYLMREPRGATMFFMGCSAPALPVPAMPAIQMLVMAAHYSIEGLTRLQVESCLLSPKERLCLQHFLEGLSAKQTAEAVGLTKKTVEHYLESARKRLGVKTTSAAAYKAFDRGWLTLDLGGNAAAAG